MKNSPLNHIMNAIFLVILCSRNLLTKNAKGNMLHARPTRHKTKLHTTKAGSTLCRKLKKCLKNIPKIKIIAKTIVRIRT